MRFVKVNKDWWLTMFIVKTNKLLENEKLHSSTKRCKKIKLDGIEPLKDWSQIVWDGGFNEWKSTRLISWGRWHHWFWS